MRRAGRCSARRRKNWTMWCVATEQAVHHSIKDGRSAEEAVEMLQSPDGVWMVDSYGVYTSLAKSRPGMNLAHCWTHVRRHFIDIETAFPEQAKLSGFCIRWGSCSASRRMVLPRSWRSGGISDRGSSSPRSGSSF
ncbi:MAG: transposase [Myxococcota bacterium]